MYHTGRAPSTIEEAEILNGTVDLVTSRIQLDISWDPPFPFGKLLYYTVVLQSGELDNSNSTANRTFESINLSVSRII